MNGLVSDVVKLKKKTDAIYITYFWNTKLRLIDLSKHK